MDARHQLARVNDEIKNATVVAQQRWSAFDEARTRGVNAMERKSADSDSLVNEAETQHKSYEQAASEVAKLERAREVLWKDLAGQGNDSRAPELKAPGAWLGHAVKALKAGASGAEFKTLSSTGGFGDAVTPIEFSQSFFDRLAPASVGLASGFTVVETQANELRVPRLTGDPAADWTAEGSPLPLADTAGDTIIAKPKKLGVVEGVTREVWVDSNPAILAISEQAIVRNISLKLDLGFFEGDPTANTASITGLKNQPGTQIVDMGTNGAPPNIDALADAIGLLSSANANATAIAMHPRTFNALRKQKSSVGEYLLNDEPASMAGATPLSLFGVPIYLTSQISTTESQGTASNATSAYVFDAARVVAVRRQDAEVTIDPWFDFRSEIVGLRVTVRWDVVLPTPAAVVRVRGITP
jgi:HK97 family phage major capsid protein